MSVFSALKMNHILKIGFCLILMGISWIPIANSQRCDDVGYFEKCQVCAGDRSCPKCINQNEECGYDKRCRCKRGYGRSLTGCSPAIIAKYRAVCDDLNDVLVNKLCDVTDDFLFCESNKCVCPIGYHRDEEVGKCITNAGAGLVLDVCSENTCQGLKCVNHKCLVPNGYKYNCETKGYNLGTKEHGDKCDEDSCSTAQPGCDPCNPNKYFECKNGVCDCKSGYTWVQNQGECIAGSEQAGAVCDAVKLCDPFRHLECKNGKCACIDRYVVDEIMNECFKLPGHDEDCPTKRCDPIDPNIVCNPETTKCECKEGYEYYTGPQKCLKYREYNETCEDIKCNPKNNLKCNTNTICDCKEGLFEYDEDENCCVICEDEEGATLEGVLIGILVVVYFGILGEVGLIVWLCRRHRRVRPVDTEEGSSQIQKNPNEKIKKKLPNQVKTIAKSKLSNPKESKRKNQKKTSKTSQKDRKIKIKP